MSRVAEKRRTTGETEIAVTVRPGRTDAEIDTPVPFFSHMLESLGFHGQLGLTVTARGDVDVDAHHLVEDTGLVLGECLADLALEGDPVRRFGHAVVPMDDALAEVAVDLSGRPFVVLSGIPGSWIGTFDPALVREFFYALATRGRFNLHGQVRAGNNSHHMVEALFKALAFALRMALQPNEGPLPSTKGQLG